jgi:hypothetical protein
MEFEKQQSQILIGETKKTYSMPFLVCHGSVASLTKGGSKGSRCDKDSFTSPDKGAGNC